MPPYILDTDTCIYWLNGDRRIEKRILAKSLATIFITVITECELYYGAYKSAHVDKNLVVLRTLRSKVKTIYTTSDAASVYSQTKATLERKGQPLDDADLLITAIAMASNGNLVTNNTGHFDRISDLQIENWRS